MSTTLNNRNMILSKVIQSKVFWIITILCILAVIALGVGLGIGLRKQNVSTRTLLVKSNDLIEVYDLDSGKFSTLVEEHIYGIISFDFYPNRTVYYATTKPNSPILSSMEKYPNLEQYTRQWTKTALAADFVGEKLYVVDNLEQKVYATDTGSKHYTVVLTDLKDPKDIVLDPYESLMFVLQGSSILQASMNGSGVKPIVEKPNLRAFTIDRSTRTIYYTTSKAIESFNYALGTHAILLSRPTEMISLSILEDQLYIVEVVQSNRYSHVVATCKLANGVCGDVGVKHIKDQVQVVKTFENDVKVMRNPCGQSNGECEQLCMLTIGPSYSCACNEGWKLNEDGKTCSKGARVFKTTCSDLTRRVAMRT